VLWIVGFSWIAFALWGQAFPDLAHFNKTPFLFALFGLVIADLLHIFLDTVNR
jgi:hypothetical protein